MSSSKAPAQNVPGEFQESARYPELPEYSGSTFKADKGYHIPSVKLDNIDILTGHENYEDWSEAMTIVFDAMMVTEIVIDGLSPPEDAENDELVTFKRLKSQSLLVLIQMISKPILTTVAKKRDPHLIWVHLRDTYHRDTAFSFVQQIMTFTSLPSTYDSDKPIGDFIERFDTEWNRLTNLAAGSNDTYRRKFYDFLEQDKAKRDFLLGFLVNHHQNVVDNLTTKDDLSYSDVVQRMRSLSTNTDGSSSTVAFKVQATKKPYKKSSDFKRPTTSGSGNHTPEGRKECTYCKKHSPGNQLGHLWHECRRLKAKNEEKKKESSAKVAREDNSDHALASTVSNPSVTHTWIFDTGASSHMTRNKELFTQLSPIRRNVKIGDSTRLQAQGKGTVILNCVLPDGSISSLRLNEVLYVPDLDCSLFSWLAVRNLNKGFTMVDDGIKGIEIKQNENLVLWAEKHGNLFYIPEPLDVANVADFQHWHQSFGHAAPSALRHKEYYSDGHLLPTPPNNFHCETCSLSKSTHSVPASVTKRATRKLELIHSDLSGRFPNDSLTKKRYYMTLVDDFTRATWVYCLKNKSDAVNCIIDFVTLIERQTNTTILRFRTDNGGEYVNNTLQTFFKNHGILHETTPAYNHESNGVAERLNRTLQTMMRAMLINLDKRLWEEAIYWAVYLKNRLHHSAVKNRTPYEAFRDEKPSIQHLHPFGSECYVHIPTERRPPGSKLLPRAEKGIFVGYPNDSIHLLKIYFPTRNKIQISPSRDVSFAPSISEGAATTSHPQNAPLPPTIPPNANPQLPPTTDVNVPLNNNETYPHTKHWQDWCLRNPVKALEMYNNGHPRVYEALNPILAARANSDITSSSISSTNHSSSLNDSQSSTGTVAPPSNSNLQVAIRNPQGFDPNDYERFSQMSIDTPSSSQNQRIQLAQQQVTTRAGRVVQQPDRYGFQHQPPLAPVQHNFVNYREITNTEDSDSDDSDDIAATTYALKATSNPMEPKSYHHALRGPNSDDWKAAMDDELHSLKKNKTWIIVDEPKGRKVINCMWVFRLKYDSSGNIERYKARLVARGDSQIAGADYDELFAPVVRFDSLRLLLAISASKKWRPRQLDVKTAFLYGILKEEIYMRLPEGSRIPGKVCKLLRCLYGLKQSPREWYARLTDYLLPYGFAIAVFDPCVMIHESGNLFIAIYVDDITVFGPSDDLTERIISALKTEFEVKDLGPLHWLLGIKIDFTDTAITLSQETYIDKILDKFGMTDCNSVSTPLDKNMTLREGSKEQQIDNISLYQQIIGSLMYAVTGTRPDLAYTVTHLSQFSSSPTQEHLQAAKRVLRFLKGSRSQTLSYRYGQPLFLEAYCDASHGNCLDSRRSFWGYIFQLGTATISWRCRRQKSVTTSTAEAEYMSLSNTAKHHLWTMRALKELLKDFIPEAIRCDNTGAIDISENHRINDRSKHIDIHYHFVRELVEAGTITVLHIDGKDNLADVCTKALPKDILDHLCPPIFGSDK